MNSYLTTLACQQVFRLHLRLVLAQWLLSPDKKIDLLGQREWLL